MTEKPLERRLQTGLRITQRKDPLREITLQRLYEGIRDSKEPLRDAIEQLRAIKSVDEQQYRQLKTQLPYFVCGVFHPPVRRLENLAAMHYLLLDLDHLGRIDTTPQQLRQRLRADERLVLDFVSPGGDGLKLMFVLSEPVFDAELYRLLYKWFAAQFAERYGLQEVVDMRTHDPTRACFLSSDPDARLNEQAVPIDVAAFREALEAGQLRQIEAQARKVAAQQPPSPVPEEQKGPDKETLRKIKERLGTRVRGEKEKRTVYVPPEVDKAVQYLEKHLAETYDITIEKSRPIQYGRQIRVRAGNLWAEINLFYGKRGYRVVPTTKTGSNQELGDLARKAIGVALEEMIENEWPDDDPGILLGLEE